MRISAKILTLGMVTMAMVAPIEAVSADIPAPETVRQDVPQVRPRTGGIDIDVSGESPVHVEIFALTGQALKQFEATPGTTSVDLPSGIYIVRVGHTAKTVKVQ